MAEFSIMRFCCFLTISIVAVAGGGCGTGGGGLHKVTLRIVKGGVPIKTPESTGLTVILIPSEEAPKETFPGNYDFAAGACEIPGRDHQGVPAGKYKVSLLFMSAKMTPEMMHWNSVFSQEKTNILQEIAGAEPITIDLDYWLKKSP